MRSETGKCVYRYLGSGQIVGRGVVEKTQHVTCVPRQQNVTMGIWGPARSWVVDLFLLFIS
eukprot:2675473-Rhodomonas_salina.1